MEAPDFWDDPEKSQSKMKELKSMKDDVATYAKLKEQDGYNILFESDEWAMRRTMSHSYPRYSRCLMILKAHMTVSE